MVTERPTCSVRYTRVCDFFATRTDEHGQLICDACARKGQRAQQPPPSRPPGSRGAPTHGRRRVLDRDQHRCRLRYSGCLGVATEVDHVRGVAAILHAGGARQQADDPSNLAVVCSACHRIKSKREAAEGSAAHNRRRAATRRARLRLPVEKHPGD